VYLLIGHLLLLGEFVIALILLLAAHIDGAGLLVSVGINHFSIEVMPLDLEGRQAA